MDPENKNPQSPDPSSFLLPKKDIHSVDSAQRVSAGVLFNQEQKVAQAAPTPTPKTTIERVVVPKTGVAQGEKIPETTSVRPLETYQGDIEKYIQEKNISTVTIAAAEANRRSAQLSQPTTIATNEIQPTQEEASGWGQKIVFILASAVLIVSAIGGVTYAVLRSSTVPLQTDTQAPFIVVDDRVLITLSPGNTTRSALFQELQAATKNTKLSTDLVAQILPIVTATNTQQVAMPAEQFFSLLGPTLSAPFLRTISPLFLFGIHAISDNQPFLLLKVDSYQQAFSGMLAWEPTMSQDLLPLFAYTPPAPPQTQTITTTISTTTASTTSTATSTLSSTTTIETLPPRMTPTVFIDKIIENHDARALVNQAGQITLLWTLLDKNTLLITTNERTVREIISRLKEAPIESQMGQ